MQSFTKVFAAVVLATLVSTSPVADVEERQLSGIPSIICLTGVLSGVLPSGISIIECSTGETCTALDIPIIDSLLPIGTCTVKSA